MDDRNRILRSAQAGEPAAAAALAALLYDELHAIARREMANERVGHTLQPTALVNEAYLRLIVDQDTSLADRDAFFAAAATTIRRVLVEHARRRAREKRGGGAVRVPLEDIDCAAPLPDDELLALDEAMAQLATFDPRKARIVELRFFAGLTMTELGRAMGASEVTIQREWRLARAWLRSHLEARREC